MSAGEWTAERIAASKEMCEADCGDDWQTAAIAFRREYRAALDAIEALQAEVRQATYEGDLSTEAVGLIRDILADEEAQIPCAAFVDDHVGNAVVLLKEAKKRDQRREQLLREDASLFETMASRGLGLPATEARAKRIRAEIGGEDG